MNKLLALPPNLQISFYYKLREITELHLDVALRKTVSELKLDKINGQLSKTVPSSALTKLASYGLRGELVFAIPVIIERNPFLLGYYRTLLGFSQKEFYSQGGYGKFKRMEESGDLGRLTQANVSQLCNCLSQSAKLLIDAFDRLKVRDIRDLQLLTIGAQLRGSENNRIGVGATQDVFDLIEDIVGDYIVEKTKKSILVNNDSGRKVLIEFGADPDVKITQFLDTGIRPIVSIEIKGGSDVSNIHNRIGEAEKSHQKAKKEGCNEFWTILKAVFDPDTAQSESPTTSRFFNLDMIRKDDSPEHQEFRAVLTSLIGIKG